ncbi:sensor histidine kinase [Streptomyces hoynatensis]|uniref:sensor histidine kinase n=1 Tax=Streptomyces hoynatensis TaxID=1141874 RepID=UPI001F4DC6BE|nr:histidine kinase [Streptomyces hoynatensis]
MPWLPHAAIALTALVLMGSTAAGAYGDIRSWSWFGALCVGLPPLLALSRPVAAWWLSLAGAASLAYLEVPGAWPWTGPGLAAHLLVMAVAAASSGPRLALGIWALTALFGHFWETHNPVWFSARDLAATGGSLLLLVLVLLTRGLLLSRSEARWQTAVSARERARHAQLEERAAIARELHDVVAHHMSVVAIQAEAAPYRVSEPPGDLVRAFATIRENAVVALGELRRVLGVVRAEGQAPADAPQPTLAALDALLGNVREAGLRVEKSVRGTPRLLPPSVELTAYRIAQEALSNGLRHAPGARATLELSYGGEGLGLRVVNGPASGPVMPSPGAGHGLAGMRERVAMLGGELACGPAGDGGYEVLAFLPAPAPGGAARAGTAAGEAGAA